MEAIDSPIISFFFNVSLLFLSDRVNFLGEILLTNSCELSASTCEMVLKTRWFSNSKNESSTKNLWRKLYFAFYNTSEFSTLTKYEVLSISFQAFFFVQAFKIVVDPWKFTMLLLYIFWDDWSIFMISSLNEQLQQQLEYTLLKPAGHSWWISKM